MKVIVGLGNPGQTYRDTRHNVGFLVIQCLADSRKIAIHQRLVNPQDGRPAGVMGEYAQTGETVRVVMPLTMMNESGDALVALSVLAQDVLIVCDDVQLPLGTLRLRPNGGPGGHHGLQSCLQAMETEEVARLRVGVGSGELPSDLRDFVLSPFRNAERPLVKRMIQEAARACDAWVTEGMLAAMNHYNRAYEI